MDNGKERRKDKRFPANPKIQLMNQSYDVKDVSISGLAFYMGIELEIGNSYPIVLEYPAEQDHFNGVNLHVNVVIAYCQREQDNRVHVGVKFENLSADDQAELAGLCNFLQQINAAWGLDWEPR